MRLFFVESHALNHVGAILVSVNDCRGIYWYIYIYITCALFCAKTSFSPKQIILTPLTVKLSLEMVSPLYVDSTQLPFWLHSFFLGVPSDACSHFKVSNYEKSHHKNCFGSCKSCKSSATISLLRSCSLSSRSFSSTNWSSVSWTFGLDCLKWIKLDMMMDRCISWCWISINPLMLNYRKGTGL